MTQQTALTVAEGRTLSTHDAEALWLRLQPSKGETLGRLIERGQVTIADLVPLKVLLAGEEEGCRPASNAERLALVEALLQHYPPRAFSGGEQQFWLDWMSDTDGLPAPILAEACAKWRRSAEKWGPSSGQLLAKVRPDWRFRLLLLRRAVVALENVDKGIDTPADAGA